MDGRFVISLDGLSQGVKVLEWTAGKEFFEGFGNGEISAADIRVRTTIEKSGSFIGVDCTMEGTVTVPCDRCLGDLRLPVSTTALISVKFTEENQVSMCERQEDGREVIALPKDMAEFDLDQVVYDYVCTSVPMVHCHEDGLCDQSVVKYLSEECTEVIDNPFASLGELFDKKNK